MIVCASCGASFEETSMRFCGRCGSDMGRRSGPDGGADPLIGRVIDARYRVISKIGQGGMGAVYKVEHLAMGKIAAMKVLHPSLTQELDVMRRFRREAEAVSRLSHPNTVQVFDFGESHGSTFLVMELVRGEDLGSILRRDGPLPFHRVRPIVVQVCDALTEAHEIGIIHRDLKPENLLVSRTRDGRDVVKVLDFGLAKLRDTEELNQVTARGSLIGTPFYMSPEQIRSEDLDARSDLYSLGALLYRVLTGEHPFSAATPVAVLTQHLTEPLTPPGRRRPDLKILPAVDALVVRAMQKKRADRFESAEDLKRALEGAAAADSQPIQLSASATVSDEGRRRSDTTGATAIGLPERMKREDFDAYERGLRRRRWLGVAVVPLVLLGAAGVVYYASGGSPLVRDSEVEPNDTAATANAIALSRPIRGQIGKRISVEESDRDFYRLTISSPIVARIEVTGIPDMDLKVVVFDAKGRKVEESDSGGPGDSELIPNLHLLPGDYYVDVREEWIAGKQATENVSDWYKLTVTASPPAADKESEPDDTVQNARPIDISDAGAIVSGTLWQTGDVDLYRTRPASGLDPTGLPFVGTVSGVPGVDLRVVVIPPGQSYSGRETPLPPGARVFDEGALGAGERMEGLAGALIVVERKERPGPKGHTTVIGRDLPYALSLRVKH
jgi:serine/threonine-protein kinase